MPLRVPLPPRSRAPLVIASSLLLGGSALSLLLLDSIPFLRDRTLKHGAWEDVLVGIVEFKDAEYGSLYQVSVFAQGHVPKHTIFRFSKKFDGKVLNVRPEPCPGYPGPKCICCFEHAAHPGHAELGHLVLDIGPTLALVEVHRITPAQYHRISGWKTRTCADLVQDARRY